MWIVNTDQHYCPAQGLTLVSTESGGTMLVHPNIVKDEQWTMVVSTKTQKIKKEMDCHIIFLLADDYDTSTSLLTESEQEQIVLMEESTLVKVLSQKNRILNNMLQSTLLSHKQTI